MFTYSMDVITELFLESSCNIQGNYLSSAKPLPQPFLSLNDLLGKYHQSVW